MNPNNRQSVAPVGKGHKKNNSPPDWLAQKIHEAQAELLALPKGPRLRFKPEVVPFIKELVIKASEQAPLFQTYTEFQVWFSGEFVQMLQRIKTGRR
jgi:hypothetical protein